MHEGVMWQCFGSGGVWRCEVRGACVMSGEQYYDGRDNGVWEYVDTPIMVWCRMGDAEIVAARSRHLLELRLDMYPSLHHWDRSSKTACLAFERRCVETTAARFGPRRHLPQTYGFHQKVSMQPHALLHVQSRHMVRQEYTAYSTTNKFW